MCIQSAVTLAPPTRGVVWGGVGVSLVVSSLAELFEILFLGLWVRLDLAGVCGREMDVFLALRVLYIIY